MTATNGKRIPALDGVRALAIAFVLFGHSLMTPGHQVLSSLAGTFGVSIFLVLSGYLITRTMLSDEQAHGRLRIGAFYTRRIRRIFPAFYVFLATLAVLSYLYLIPAPDRQTWQASALYFRNLAGTGYETGHLWSLSLEEQFYLCWPLLFVLTRRRRLRFIACVVFLLIVRRAIWIHSYHGAAFPITRVGGLYWRPDLRLDTFLIGGAFAIADWRWAKRAPVVLIVFALCLWCPFAPFAGFLAPIDTVVTAFLLGILVACLVANPAAAASRLLSCKPVRIIGEISYSIYLWQELFVRFQIHWWTFPALALVSGASFRFVERPFLAKRYRPARVKTPTVQEIAFGAL
jgi:peptidoglycan/LPS O-acetylase OafA/YrhL